MSVLRWITYRAFCGRCGDWISEARWDVEDDAGDELHAHERAVHESVDSGGGS